MDFYIRAVEDRKKELLESLWLSKVLAEIETVCNTSKIIRCLALGQITEFVNPRFQLALLLIIADHLQIKEISAWDPVFSDVDKLILNHFNIKVSESNQTGSDVLFYVPHGPLKLVTDLPELINGGVYIGNDLAKFEAKSKKMMEYQKMARIISIEPNTRDRWFNAFNSTAIHSTK